MERIRANSGDLVTECIEWIYPAIERWLQDDASHVLWIRGDPGTGKTRLSIALIDQMASQIPHLLSTDYPGTKLKILTPSLLSFFFFRASDSNTNNAASAFRGLLLLLAKQSAALKKKLEQTGYRDSSDGIELRLLLSEILKSTATPTLLVLDALDECRDTERKVLLPAITHFTPIAKPGLK